MTKIENRRCSRYNFENNAISSGTKTLGSAANETAPQAEQRLSIDKIYCRSGDAGSVDYFDITVSETTGGRVILKHRFHRPSWAVGEKLYGNLFFPGGLVAAAGTTVGIEQDTVDSGVICHTDVGHLEPAA